MNSSDEPPVPAAFVRHLRAHNRRALGWTLACAAAAALLWAAAYLLIWWWVLLAVSVGFGIDAEMPRRFAHAFASGALLCLVIAALWKGHPPAPAGGLLRRGLLELLLTPARATWAALANLRAVCRLDRAGLEAAWALASALAGPGRIEVTALPLLVPDPRVRDRALLALQLSGLVTLRPGPQGWFALLADEQARRVCSPKIRLPAA